MEQKNSKKRKLNLAMVQMKSEPADLQCNLKKIAAYAKKAAEDGAELVVYPELCTCGYYLERIAENPEAAAMTPEGEAMQMLQATAAEYQLYLVIGAMLKRNGRFTNSAVLLGPSGEIIHIHDKVYLWGMEKELFDRGTSFQVTELPFGKMGIMICYDAGFPENARQMARQGAELLLTPAAFAEVHRDRWNTYYKTRALENTCWVAGINAAGGYGEEVFFGNNLLFAPDGRNVVSGKNDKEELQIYEIDLKQADWAHKMASYLGELVEQES